MEDGLLLLCTSITLIFTELCGFLAFSNMFIYVPSLPTAQIHHESGNSKEFRFANPRFVPIPYAPCIFTYILSIFGVNVGKYSSTMEHLGIPVALPFGLMMLDGFLLQQDLMSVRDGGPTNVNYNHHGPHSRT